MSATNEVTGRAVVLVVEDEPIIRMHVADVLAGAGFGVLEAKTAEEGIELLSHESAIRAVVSDIDTPGRYDGFALAWYARSKVPARPCPRSGHLRKSGLALGLVADKVLCRCQAG
jgi:CheY-like chemotaxis protein